MHVAPTLGLLLIGAANLAAESAVPLKHTGGYLLVDAVFLNGAGPYRFLVDTGATTNKIDSELAKGLGLKASYKVDLVTLNGSASVPGALIDSMRLGDAEVHRVEVLWAPLDEIRAVDREIRGIVGQEFLHRFSYVLDLRRHRLVFDPKSIAGEELAVERVDGRMAIRARASGAEKAGRRLILDSGATAIYLFDDAPIHRAIVSQMRTATGTTELQTGFLKELRLGNRVYRDVPAARIARNGGMEDGILPLSLFKAVYFSSAKGVVILDPAGF